VSCPHSIKVREPIIALSGPKTMVYDESCVLKPEEHSMTLKGKKPIHRSATGREWT